MIIDTQRVDVYPSNDLVCIDLHKNGERTHIVLTRKEALYLGMWTDFPFTITDGGAYITFRENWVRYCYVSSNMMDRSRGSAEIKDFTFPFEVIRAGLDSVTMGNSLGWTMTPMGMEKLFQRYRPRYQFKWIDESQIYLALSRWNLIEPFIKGWRRIAKNHSDGRIVTIYIAQDGWGNRRARYEPGDRYNHPSWAFNIVDYSGRRIINGGLIWHGGEHGYSIHT
jgi:hypothetical protein